MFNIFQLKKLVLRLLLLLPGCLSLTGDLAAQNSPAAGTGKKYAILVGVETYDPTFFNALNYAEEDVRELASALEKLEFDVTLMTAQAKLPAHKPNTAKKILAQIAERCKKLEAADTLVVALSGHGVQFTKQPKLEDGSRESYFCPEEADLRDLDSLVPLSGVMQLIAQSSAERKLLIVDACRNEAESELFKSSKEQELEPVGLVPRTVPRGMLTLYSCSDSEKSVEHPELKHGVFTFHVAKYLRGEATNYPGDQISLTGLAGYATRETSDFVKKKLDRDQTPVLVSPTGISDWPLGMLTTGKSALDAEEIALRKEFAAKLLEKIGAKIADTQRASADSNQEDGVSPKTYDVELAWCYAQLGNEAEVLRRIDRGFPAPAAETPANTAEENDAAPFNATLDPSLEAAARVLGILKARKPTAKTEELLARIMLLAGKYAGEARRAFFAADQFQERRAATDLDQFRREFEYLVSKLTARELEDFTIIGDFISRTPTTVELLKKNPPLVQKLRDVYAQAGGESDIPTNHLIVAALCGEVETMIRLVEEHQFYSHGFWCVYPLVERREFANLKKFLAASSKTQNTTGTFKGLNDLFHVLCVTNAIQACLDAGLRREAAELYEQFGKNLPLFEGGMLADGYRTRGGMAISHAASSYMPFSTSLYGRMNLPQDYARAELNRELQAKQKLNPDLVPAARIRALEALLAGQPGLDELDTEAQIVFIEGLLRDCFPQ
ncbi:MAG: caspase family protein [Pirellulales bacterium]|nr:caspase family protein [Pirellulales bacterium]